MRKIILNPQYKSLYTFIETLPQNFNAGGEIVQDRRNTIKKFKVNGLEINVKRYRVPIFINRIAYTFFRKSKACRAYNNAFEVIKRGFETPESIAYIEEFKGGLLHYSYYISLQCPYRREIREYYQGPLQGNEALMTAFAQFTAALHEKGVCHEDYSPGNVLIAQIDGQYHFSLVDINRMTFKPMNLEEGCKNFRRMFISDELYIFLAKKYAQCRNFDQEACIRLMLKYNHYSIRRDQRKERSKAIRKKICGYLNPLQPLNDNREMSNRIHFSHRHNDLHGRSIPIYPDLWQE